MKFERILINGFRGIKKLEIDNLSKINLFVGKNNSSKTSILESIYILTGAYNPNFLIQVDNYRSLLLNTSNDLRYVFYNLDFKNELKIEGYGDSNKYSRIMKVTPNKRKIIPNQNIQGLIMNPLTGVIQSQPQPQSNAIIDEEAINELITNYTVKEEHKQKRDYKCSVYHLGGYAFQSDIQKGLTPDLKTNYLPLALNTLFDATKVLSELIINKKQDAVIKILKKVDKSIKNISISKNMIYADIDGMEQLMPLNLGGDGIRKLLSILLAIYDSKDGMVFIDEIENGLHFSAFKELWLAIFEFAELYNVQLFATTHSFETLKYLTEILDSPEQAKYQDSVRSYTIRKLESLEHKAYCYKFSEFENAIKEGIEIR